MDNKLTMLMILDGFGINEIKEGNAYKLANTPNLDKLFKTCPNTKLQASSLAVGLPKNQMGNSEVGHTNIGAGRIVYQDLVKISNDIESNKFYDVKEFNDAIDNAIKNNTNLHLIGLLSDGGVHSHINHLYGLLNLCKKRNFSRVYIHAFMDGRDTPLTSGINYIKDLEDKIKEIGFGSIATISGRFYAMDRDNRWERVKKAYDAIVNGIGINFDNSIGAITNSYDNNVTDEFVIPTIIDKNGMIKKQDSVIFYNFRSDRARELTRVLVDSNFDEFETKNLDLFYVCMSEYDKTMPNVCVAYKKENLKNTFGEYISKKGLKQLRIAETEKYAHVTFFFNGGVETKFDNEDRILVPSPKVTTYDLKPEMSAYEVCDKVVLAIEGLKYNSIILNFANTDMVGHTGNLNAAIKAVEAIDLCIERIVRSIDKVGGVLIITADHGNCEQMIDYDTKKPHTAHTTNLVPLIIYGLPNIKLNEGKLCDIAPTMLDIMNIKIPVEMTGKSLIYK